MQDVHPKIKNSTKAAFTFPAKRFAMIMCMAVIAMLASHAHAQIIVIDAIDFRVGAKTTQSEASAASISEFIQVFPNPVSVQEDLTIAVPYGAEIDRVKIYNETGKLMANIKIDKIAKNQTGITEPGTYRMVIFSKSERITKSYILTE